MPFKVYMREDDMGGQVFIEKDFDTAEAAESFAFRTMMQAPVEEQITFRCRPDGAFSTGEDDNGPWGGEFVLTADAWGDDEYRLVMTTEDD